VSNANRVPIVASVVHVVSAVIEVSARHVTRMLLHKMRSKRWPLRLPLQRKMQVTLTLLRHRSRSVRIVRHAASAAHADVTAVIVRIAASAAHALMANHVVSVAKARAMLPLRRRPQRPPRKLRRLLPLHRNT